MRGLFLLTLAACAGANKPPATGPEPAAPTPQAPDPKSLVEELKLTVLESYRAIGSDYSEAYQETLAKGSRNLFIGARRNDVVVGFDVARAIAIHRYFPEDRLEIVSQDLTARLSADHTLGWVNDHLSYRVGRGRRQGSIPLRASAAYFHKDARWGKAFEHVSYPRSREDLIADARADRLGTPALIPASVLGADAEAAVSTVHQFLGDGPAPAAPSDFLLIPPWDAEEHQARTVAALFGKGVSVKAQGFFVEASPGQTLAWVAANLVLQGPDYSLPLRATWILERRDGEYRAVQMHISVPLPDNFEQVMFGQ
jgi:hypothetical protein